jgi:hypothetical protein
MHVAIVASIWLRHWTYKYLNCVDFFIQGLDIVGVETVINYHCPNDITMWVLITNIASFESFLCILFDLVHEFWHHNIIVVFADWTYILHPTTYSYFEWRLGIIIQPCEKFLFGIALFFGLLICKVHHWNKIQHMLPTSEVCWGACSYVHRVGRTARAGRKGCAVTFVTERERSLLRAIVSSYPCRGAWV